jgi:lipopolysaccharide/colanic/teichoic acid biosynthesis glycosyltransferase
LKTLLNKKKLIYKRIFDLALSLFLLPFLIIPIIVLIFIATINTKQFGLFTQIRVGQNSKIFKIYKVRTLKKEIHVLGNLEKSATPFGRFLRNSKLDELPQLFNVLLGNMSFVGPRPDIKGFADRLEGEDRIILVTKPGITGSATLKYKDEETILAKQLNPEIYNRKIIWVDKVKINKKYVQNWSFCLDLKLILKSIFN